MRDRPEAGRGGPAAGRPGGRGPERRRAAGGADLPRCLRAAAPALSGDADLAADLTQETYRKAWAALPGFDRRAQFSTWLFRIAYTTFLNHLRRPRRLVPLEEKHEATVPDPAPAADEVVGRDMEGDRLRRAVLALPDELRYLVTAIFWGDLPVKEVARQEGITPVAIRKRLKKALRLLALALEEDAR